ATKVGTTMYWYNANGDMTVGNGLLAYDLENRLTKMTSARFSGGADSLIFEYSVSGSRNRKFYSGTGEWTTYLGDDYEVTRGLSTKYFSVGDRLVAKRVQNGTNWNTYWLHVDHQGSINAITDATNTVVRRYSYEPYGEIVATTGRHFESR